MMPSIPSAPLRWLLVGAGDIARKRVAPALQNFTGSHLESICAAHLNRAAELAAAVGAQRAYDDYERALDDPSVNAVYIATPVALHVPQAIRALEAGKHVLIEKPLGIDGPSALRIAEYAHEKGMIAGCAYYRRCYPSVAYARQLLQQGALGEPVELRTSYCSWFNPPADDPKYWRVCRDQSGGGPLADMGSHMLDLMVALLGIPRSVFAKTATQTHSYEVEDSASFLLTFGGGVRAYGSFHWNSRTWTHEFEIVGTEGRLRWSPFDAGVIVRTIGRDSEEIRLPNAENVHAPLIADFVASVHDQRFPIARAEEAAKTNRILDAIYASARSGREITL